MIRNTKITVNHSYAKVFCVRNIYRYYWFDTDVHVGRMDVHAVKSAAAYVVMLAFLLAAKGENISAGIIPAC